MNYSVRCCYTCILGHYIRLVKYDGKVWLRWPATLNVKDWPASYYPNEWHLLNRYYNEDDDV